MPKASSALRFTSKAVTLHRPKIDPLNPRARFITSAARPDQFPLADRPEVAFAGRSNVGKSSLLNRLLASRKLARTSRTPGRTQTINFFEVAETIYFVDLPGFGYAKVPLAVRQAWRPMVESYLSAPRDLRAVVVLVDIRRDPPAEEQALLTRFNQHGPTPLLVITKADKLSRGRRQQRVAVISRALKVQTPPVVFSAMTGEGREDLWDKILELCSGEPPEEKDGMYAQ